MVSGHIQPVLYCSHYRRILVHHPVGKVPCRCRAATEPEHIKLHLRDRRFIAVTTDKYIQCGSNFLKSFIGLGHHSLKPPDKAAAQPHPQQRVAFPICRPDAADVGFHLRLHLIFTKGSIRFVKVIEPGNIGDAALPAGVACPLSGVFFILRARPGSFLTDQTGAVGIRQPQIVCVCPVIPGTIKEPPHRQRDPSDRHPPAPDDFSTA
ncbi:hypothetical protein AC26_1079 [Escherichia coli 1-176-05_S3_C2]|nr:hypothetical protein AC26_1079 [Escherichia coli 1-176-05_S3_C2]